MALLIVALVLEAGLHFYVGPRHIGVCLQVCAHDGDVGILHLCWQRLGQLLRQSLPGRKHSTGNACWVDVVLAAGLWVQGVDRAGLKELRQECVALDWRVLQANRRA